MKKILILLFSIFYFLFSIFYFAYADTAQTSVLVKVTEVAPPSGGGGGGLYIPPTRVIIQGRAYPKSLITVLIDGKTLATIIADSSANFKTEIDGFSAGVYTFNLRAEDSKNYSSPTQSFTVSISSGVITTVSGLFLPPTIEISKDQLISGEILEIFGASSPNSQIIVYTYSSGGEPLVKKTRADELGVYLYRLDTSELEIGDHNTKARAMSEDEKFLSDYSRLKSFKIAAGLLPVPKKPSEVTPTKTPIPANLNGDFDKKGEDIVHLVDVSILLYNWGKPKNPKADLNKDGKVSLTDFSILLYYWTG